MKDENKVIVYTKGSGESRDGKYGWAYTLENMSSENNDKSDSFRTEMYAVLSALKAVDKSAAIEIRTNNEAIAKICKGEYKADKSLDLYEEYKELEKYFIEAGGKVIFTYIPAEERDKHFDEVRKMARDEIVS